MQKHGYVLAIDQGTTSSRAIVFDAKAAVVAVSQREFKQYFPSSGWVEHDPEEIWSTTLRVCRAALKKAEISASDLISIGITNQRETTIVWDRATGKPVCNAIVWQDRRTAGACAAYRKAGHESVVSAKTGLLLDPYFSATKVAWILENVEGARTRAENGDLAFGTIDTFLLWRLTNGRVHATDATNASRTMLCNIHDGTWDADLLALFNIPASLLPEIRDSSGRFGLTDAAHLGAAVPVSGMAGDQQAATVGQACFKPGMMKSTYGTGCFALLNTGETAVQSGHKLLTTVAYQLKGKRTYALEGSIFIAGAAVQWLRDGLKIIKSAGETGEMAAAADTKQNVYMVPAFVGLGAPYWDADARGALYGLTRATGPNELVLAALESVCFQTCDLFSAMKADWPDAEGAATVLRVDGGMVASDWTMQRLSDLLGAPVDRPVVMETTALGAAYLAGLAEGFYPEPAAFAAGWHLDRRFEPNMAPDQREGRLSGWRDAVSRTLTTR